MTRVPGRIGVLLAIAVLAIVLGMAGSAALAKDNAAAKDKVHRVVMHVTDNDPKTYNQVLNNISSITSTLGIDNVQIELVVNGLGLDMFMKDSKLAPRLQGLSMNGNLKYSICENTMAVRKLTKADLLQAEYMKNAFVPAGIVRAMELQEQGWSYIKP